MPLFLAIIAIILSMAFFTVKLGKVGLRKTASANSADAGALAAASVMAGLYNYLAQRNDERLLADYKKFHEMAMFYGLPHASPPIPPPLANIILGLIKATRATGETLDKIRGKKGKPGQPDLIGIKDSFRANPCPACDELNNAIAGSPTNLEININQAIFNLNDTALGSAWFLMPQILIIWTHQFNTYLGLRRVLVEGAQQAVAVGKKYSAMNSSYPVDTSIKLLSSAPWVLKVQVARAPLTSDRNYPTFILSPPPGDLSAGRPWLLDALKDMMKGIFGAVKLLTVAKEDHYEPARTLLDVACKCIKDKKSIDKRYCKCTTKMVGKPPKPVTTCVLDPIIYNLIGDKLESGINLHNFALKALQNPSTSNSSSTPFYPYFLPPIKPNLDGVTTGISSFLDEKDPLETSTGVYVSQHIIRCLADIEGGHDVTATATQNVSPSVTSWSKADFSGTGQIFPYVPDKKFEAAIVDTDK